VGSNPTPATCMNSEARPLVEIDQGSDIWDQKRRPVIWETEILGRKFIVERFGVCFWQRIRLLEEREEQTEVYRLDLGGDYKTRREFFLGKQIREYLGNQPCFVEFWELANQLGRAPSLGETKTKIGMSQKVAGRYQGILKRLLT